jgi:hypothetical protein
MVDDVPPDANFCEYGSRGSVCPHRSCPSRPQTASCGLDPDLRLRTDTGIPSTAQSKEEAMKDSGGMHKKVQEMCDCYATNDPLKEMSTLKNDSDTDVAAIKWVALAALHGVNNNAKEISIQRGDDGRITVLAEYKITELPSPGQDAGLKIFEAFREMTHIDSEKGKTALALGIRDSSIELNVEIKMKNGKEKVSIGFPKK